MENVYSLAYILRSLRPQVNRIEISTKSINKSTLVHRPSWSYPLLSDSNTLMYLGDLDDLSIKQALESYIPIHVSVLIPPHHGNRWHPMMWYVHTELTYLNRCNKHVHVSLKRKLRLRYLDYSSIVIGGHRYNVYILTTFS